MQSGNANRITALYVFQDFETKSDGKYTAKMSAGHYSGFPVNKKEQVKILLGYINKTIYESLPDKKKIEYSLVL